MKLFQRKQTVETRSRETPPSVRPQARFTVGTVLALSITIFCWASAFVGIRVGLHGYSPTHLALLRYITASLVLALFAGVKRMPLPHWRDLPGLALTGVVGIALYNIALNTGEVSVSAGISSFLVNTAPIITAGLSMVLLRERLRIWGWIGILICILGASLTTLNTGEGIHFSLGALFVLCAALAQGLYFVWQKPYLARYSALQCTTYAIWTGTLALLVFSPGLVTNMRTASWSETVAVVYLGVFPAALGYVTWAYALARIPATRAASFLYLVPAVTLGIAWLWLGEWPTWLALSGGGIAISGVIIVNVFGKTQMHKTNAS
ncbi:MAG TPA: EamA family transporter [Ktedonobacteraceae bacterium]|jgi:drug/metabolite transporter (DMT)-like permease